jgi:hypothetical protein
MSLTRLYRRIRTSLVREPREGVVGRTIIIGVHAGGLGDHLAYSALPRLYKRAGARKVLLSTQTDFGEPFTRNPDIRDLVWRDNPFVDGFTEEPANVGERGWPPMAFFKAAKTSASPVDTVASVAPGGDQTSRIPSCAIRDRPRRRSMRASSRNSVNTSPNGTV